MRGYIGSVFGMKCYEAQPLEWAKLVEQCAGAEDAVIKDGQFVIVAPGKWDAFVRSLDNAGVRKVEP